MCRLVLPPCPTPPPSSSSLCTHALPSSDFFVGGNVAEYDRSEPFQDIEHAVTFLWEEADDLAYCRQKQASIEPSAWEAEADSVAAAAGGGAEMGVGSGSVMGMEAAAGAGAGAGHENGGELLGISTWPQRAQDPLAGPLSPLSPPQSQRHAPTILLPPSPPHASSSSFVPAEAEAGVDRSSRYRSPPPTWRRKVGFRERLWTYAVVEVRLFFCSGAPHFEEALRHLPKSAYIRGQNKTDNPTNNPTALK